MCNNQLVIGWDLDKHRALKLCAFGLKSQQVPPLECSELKGFFVPGRTPHVSSGSQVGPLGVKPRHGMPAMAGATPKTPWGSLNVQARGLAKASMYIRFAV